MSSDSMDRVEPSERLDPHASPAGVGRAGWQEYELALDVFPRARTCMVALRREDKEVFDALQAWWHFRHGRRLTQWELFSLVLAEALENPGGRFAAARVVQLRRAG